MRLDHLLSKEFLFWNGEKDRLRNSFKDIWLCLLAKRDGVWLGMLSGFWSSAPDLTPSLRVIAFFVVVGLFGVGVLVVNCIVDASIFDLCKQY